MTGYKKGIKIKIDDNLVTLDENNIKTVGKYDKICQIQEEIIKEKPDVYDDETSFLLAECTISLMEQQGLTIHDAIKSAIENGFFPEKKE